MQQPDDATHSHPARAQSLYAAPVVASLHTGHRPFLIRMQTGWHYFCFELGNALTVALHLLRRLRFYVVNVVDLRQRRRAMQRVRQMGLRQVLVSLVRQVFWDARIINAPILYHGQRQLPQQPWPADQPLVTVIIPCYNYGRYVLEAIDSVLAQTLQDVEIIVIDPGSTDPHTLDVLAQLDRPRTRVVRREGRHLLGDNRNFGIQMARGKYITCLDADDKFLPTYLEKCVFLLESCTLDVVGTALRVFGENSEVYHGPPQPVLQEFMHGNPVSNVALYTRALWEKAGPFVDFGLGKDLIAEDWEFWVRCAAHGATFFNIIREPLFLHRDHGKDSLSKAPTVRPWAEHARDIRRINAALLTDAAFERSRLHRSLVSAYSQPLVNLADAARPVAGRTNQPTLLIAMPFLLVGGAEKLLSQLTRHLVRAGWRVMVVTTQPPEPSCGDATPWFAEHTSEIYHLTEFLIPILWPVFLDYLLRTRGVDALMVAGSRYAYEQLPRLRDAHPGLAMVDLLFNPVGHVHSNREYRRYFAAVLCENQETRHYLRDDGAPDGLLRLMPSGVDLQQFGPQHRHADQRAALAGPAPLSLLVGWFGRLSDEKNPLAVLRIARLLKHRPDIRFIVAGTGPLRPQFEAELKAQRLSDRVLDLGMRSDLPLVMAQCDCLLFTSTLDGRPMAVMEGLASGLPVLGTRVGALPELVADGETGFLAQPGDDAAQAAALLRLADDPALRERLSTAARAAAEAQLDQQRALGVYEQVLGELCQRPVSAAA